MLQKYRNDLMGFPTTNGLWATGEGHEMAEVHDAVSAMGGIGGAMGATTPW